MKVLIQVDICNKTIKLYYSCNIFIIAISGYVYCFKLMPAVEYQRLIRPDDLFGSSLSIFENVLAVGSPHDGHFKGYIYIFSKRITI